MAFVSTKTIAKQINGALAEHRQKLQEFEELKAEVTATGRRWDIFDEVCLNEAQMAVHHFTLMKKLLGC